MIQINNLFKSFAGKDILSDLSLVLDRGDKLGLIGRNGSGKSTLIKIIEKNQSQDKGKIVYPTNYKISSVQQHISFSKDSVLEECMQVLQEDEIYNEYKVEKILFGLGFSKEDLMSSPLKFSGGYQIRINLAKVLIQGPDLLLLDEPTNYLDILSIRWLANYIKKFPGEIIIITHDRSFIDSVCNCTAVITGKKIKKIKGDTAKLINLLKDEEEHKLKVQKNKEKKVKEMEQFVDKFRAKARKASQAQSKLKMVNKLKSAYEESMVEENLKFKFSYFEIKAKYILNIEDLSFKYPTMEQLLIDSFNYSFKRGETVAIIGKNGKGKSTLLKLIAENLKCISGLVKKHENCKVGFFSQTNENVLDENFSVVEEIYSSNSDLSNSHVRNICGTMMFEGDDAFKLIKVLSGGEKSRVMLGKVLAKKTNILLLDEPTNHLDIESVESLKSAIKDYDGTSVIVTHNEMLLRDLADRFIIFDGNKIEVFEGSYDEFLEKIGWAEENDLNNKKGFKKKTKITKQLRSQLVKERAKTINPIKNKIETIENEIESCELKLKEKNHEMIKVSADNLGGEVSIIAKEINILEKRLEEYLYDLEDLYNKLQIEEEKYNNQIETLD